MLSRRQLLFVAAMPPRPLIVRVQVLLDQGAHSGKGLTDVERATFHRYQERARHEYEVSGIHFDVRITDGAYLRTETYSEVPDPFLAPDRINLFITETLRLDVDSQRTGGSSAGPRPSARGVAGRFYKTFLGLREAGEGTLIHEYAHHFTLDTGTNASTRGNYWADLRNDYWLWRQRRGTEIAEFRACASAPWVRNSTSMI